MKYKVLLCSKSDPAKSDSSEVLNRYFEFTHINECPLHGRHFARTRHKDKLRHSPSREGVHRLVDNLFELLDSAILDSVKESSFKATCMA